MRIYRFILNSFLTGAFICGATGCTTVGSNVTGLYSSLKENLKKNPKSYRPYSVKYEGELTPTTGIKEVISGNTIVLVQPWVNLKKYDLRETPVYFHRNGTATSELWLSIPWSIRGNQLCMTGENINNCYKAFTDSAGQAYLMTESSQLLAKVKSIESGDSHNTTAAYHARQERLKAKREFKLAFAGLLFEAFTSGGGGGNYSGQPEYRPVYEGRSPSLPPSQPAATTRGLYGNTHTPW